MVIEEHGAPEAHVAVRRRWRPVYEGDGEVGVVVGRRQRAVEGTSDLHGDGVEASGCRRRDIHVKSAEGADKRGNKLPVDPDGRPVIDALELKARDGWLRV